MELESKLNFDEHITQLYKNVPVISMPFVD